MLLYFSSYCIIFMQLVSVSLFHGLRSILFTSLQMQCIEGPHQAIYTFQNAVSIKLTIKFQKRKTFECHSHHHSAIQLLHNFEIVPFHVSVAIEPENSLKCVNFNLVTVIFELISCTAETQRLTARLCGFHTFYSPAIFYTRDFK